MKDIKQLKNLCRNVREDILKITTPVRSSHIGGSLSVVEILTALYFRILKIDPKKPKDSKRDILIYSKGHCSSVFYSTLVERGFASREILKEYYADGGRLAGHPVMNNMPGVEISTGSLGHGLTVGVGMALARKYDKNPSRVFVIMSDGECNEGSVWEAAMFAGFHKLDNLVVVIDYNKIQACGFTKEIMDLEPLARKWESFNWVTKEIDGHNLKQIIGALKRIPFERNKPSILIANTIKGKGVSFMENKVAWHYKSLDNPEDYKKALNEVKNS